MIHPGVADDLAPPLPDSGFDADPGADVRGQHLVLVVQRLLGEPLPAGHGHHPCLDRVAGQQLLRVEGDLDLGPGRHQEHVRVLADAIRQHVPAAGDPGSGRIFDRGAV